MLTENSPVSPCSPTTHGVSPHIWTVDENTIIAPPALARHCQLIHWQQQFKLFSNENYESSQMIKAAVFDMDGLMIDSQPFWQTAQLEILPQLGVPITRQDTIDTTGMRVDQIVQMCFAASPWDTVSCDEVCDQIVGRVIALIQEHKPAMPGLNHAIDICQRQGLRLAIASSSPMNMIDATIEALELDGIFDATLSGANLRYSKPHPEVYLNACDALEFEPQSCLAIEDSFVGLLAAKSAQMKTIVIPERSEASENRFVIADQKLATLEDLTPELLRSL